MCKRFHVPSPPPSADLAIKNLFETSPLRLLNNFPFWQTEKEKSLRSSKTCKHRCFLITNKNANLMMMYSNEGKMGEWMMCLGGVEREQQIY
jgi:hypothetical protein